MLTAKNAEVSQPRMLTLTQAELSKIIILERTELLNKLGNKSYSDLMKEMKEVEEVYEMEKNQLLPTNSWKIRLPLCIAFNTLFCYGIWRYGRYA